MTNRNDTRPATRDCAMQLIQEGLWPTVPLIRSRLGSGSNSTITSELATWRKDFLKKVAQAANSAPSHWTPARIEFCDRIFNEAVGIAKHEFDEERDVLQAEFARLQQISAEAEADRDKAQQWATTEIENRTRAEQQANRLDEELAIERANVAQLRKEVADLQGAKDRLQEDLTSAAQAAREREDALRHEYEDEREHLNLAHDQALEKLRSEWERRENLAYERLEGMRTQMAEETDRQRQTFSVSLERLEHELAEAKQALSKQEQENRLKLVAAERKAAEAIGEARVLEKMLTLARAEQERLQASLTQAERRNQDTAISGPNEVAPAAVHDGDNLAKAAAYARQQLAQSVDLVEVRIALQDQFDLLPHEADELLTTVARPSKDGAV